MEDKTLPTTFAALRPHHALCVMFFEGEGYDQTFIENMTDFVGDPARLVQITDACDTVCQACPHNQNGFCDDEAKVARFDERTLRHIGSLIDFEGPIPLSSLCQAVYDTILQEDLLAQVCGECEWAALCQGKWQQDDFNRQLLPPNPRNIRIPEPL